MTAIIPVLDRMNGSDHPRALPHSATRGNALKFSDDLTEIIAVWVVEIPVATSSAGARRSQERAVTKATTTESNDDH